MFKLLLLTALTLPTDTATVVDTLNISSIKLSHQNTIRHDFIKYHHQQGFFCDFEDHINKNKKLLLNIGVGKQ